MIHFIHVLADGTLLQLVVNTDHKLPRFACTPQITAAQGPEYRQWLHEVVVPRLMDVCSAKQKGEFAKVGLKAVAKAIAGA